MRGWEVTDGKDGYWEHKLGYAIRHTPGDVVASRVLSDNPFVESGATLYIEGHTGLGRGLFT